MTDTPWYAKSVKDSMKYKGRLLPLVEEQLVKTTLERNSHRDTLHLHPSEISKKDWCPRSSWYKINKYPASAESLAFSRLNVFEEGHAIHAKWQNWLWQAGVLAGDWACKACNHKWYALAPSTCPVCSSTSVDYREVNIQNDDYRIIGHADGEINDSQGRALIEIKSLGLGTIRWENPTLYRAYSSGEIKFEEIWKNIKKPFPSHIRQGSIYMYCTGIHTIVFIYEWKPTQEVKEFIVEFQPEVIEKVLDGCKQVMDHLDTDIVPLRPNWADDPSASGCKFCPYKKECWS